MLIIIGLVLYSGLLFLKYQELLEKEQIEARIAKLERNMEKYNED